MSINFRTAVLGSAAAAALMAFTAPVAAYAQEATYNFNIPSQDLAAELRAYARATRQQVVFDGAVVRGKTGVAVVGQFTAGEGLDRLLAGSGLVARRTESGVIYVQAAGGEPSAATQPATQVQELVVTGTHIKGVPPSSPTVVLTEQAIRDEGLSSVADAIRDIPENFAGGQNPGVAVGAGGINNQNLTGSTAIDLRGLGPDATLTLLNGRRMSYDAFTQAVDVSVIPLAAVQQIQVVTDGASAIYGSDAVAGVANIILKKDYNGLDTSVRYGGATDGGDQQSQYDVTAGHTWDSGGVLLAYNYEHDDAVYANQRSYTSYMPTPYSLLPTLNEQSVLVSGHQDLGSFVHFSLDAFYSDRSNAEVLTEPPFRIFYITDTSDYLISPTLSFDLPKRWTLEVNGLYGHETSDYSEPTDNLSNVVLSPARGCYCNVVKQVEVDAEGPLFQLPGGDARLALGGGYRYNGFDNPSFTSTSDTTGSRHSDYAFGELNAPLIGPDQNVPLVHRLNFDIAARYESYSDIGDVATPKVGAVWSPTEDVDVKGSWGKSFKAPTLFQQHQGVYVELFPGVDFGPTPPAGSTVMLLGGGNPDLKPERATSVTTGLTWRPHQAPGLKFELSYFHIDYRERVVQPISTLARTFAIPGYAQFITLNPTAAQQAAALAKAGSFYNFVGVYDPTKVYALVDDTFTNIAHETLDGVDLSGFYTRPFAGGDISLNAAATWMNGNEIIAPGIQSFPIAGAVFTPPRFRVRAGVIWSGDGWTFSSYVNHQSSVFNNVYPPFGTVASQTTMDLAASYRTGDVAGVLRNVTISLAAQNLFDRAPPFLPSPSTNIVDYDSTNSSPVGRFVSLTVAKHW